jgi:hypothetical protein
MIRYRYNPSVEPPAPFVYLTLTNPATSERLEKVPAQVDSAADRTVPPATVVNDLGLEAVGEMEIGGLGGKVQTLLLYGVALSIHDCPPRLAKVVAIEGEPWVLLGRDVINNYRIVLDGPRQSLEIDPPVGD